MNDSEMDALLASRLTPPDVSSTFEARVIAAAVERRVDQQRSYRWSWIKPPVLVPLAVSAFAAVFALGVVTPAFKATPSAGIQTATTLVTDNPYAQLTEDELTAVLADLELKELLLLQEELFVL